MKILALALMIGILAISLPVFAEDGNNVPDKIGDILSGKDEQVEFWPYLAYTTKETTSLFDIPIIPKNLRIKGSTRLGQEDYAYKLEIGLEL